MQRGTVKRCGNHCTRVENVSVTLDQNNILNNVSFEMYCGELLTIIGKKRSRKINTDESTSGRDSIQRLH